MLLHHPELWRAGQLAGTQERISTGYAELDQHLRGGWPAAGLAELLLPQIGLGELKLMLPAMREQSTQSRWLAWVAPPFIPYAPALQAHGVDLDKVLMVQPPRRMQNAPRNRSQQPTQDVLDTLWALEQVSRSGACSMALAWLNETALQPAALRRLQLAAKQGGTLVCLFRPLQAAAQASMAELRLRLSAASQDPSQDARTAGTQTLYLDVLKQKGGWPVQGIALNWRTAPARPAAQFALWRKQWRPYWQRQSQAANLASKLTECSQSDPVASYATATLDQGAIH